MLPKHLERHPTKAGREALAARLSLTIGPYSQDWEWEVGEPGQFHGWLSVYQNAALTDDERFSLMEMLIQCVDDLASACGSSEPVEQLPEWRAVAALLRKRPRLHASTIAYWSAFAADHPEEQFWVSRPMRQVWAEVQSELY